jgi:hypothetical protein
VLSIVMVFRPHNGISQQKYPLPFWGVSAWPLSWRTRRTSFVRQCRKILLTRLQGSHLFAGRALEIHREPHREENDAGHASRNVLAHLEPLLVSDPSP